MRTLLISASQVARIIVMSHQHAAHMYFIFKTQNNPMYFIHHLWKKVAIPREEAEAHDCIVK
jgi:hypothetical protein